MEVLVKEQFSFRRYEAAGVRPYSVAASHRRTDRSPDDATAYVVAHLRGCWWRRSRTEQIFEANHAATGAGGLAGNAIRNGPNRGGHEQGRKIIMRQLRSAYRRPKWASQAFGSKAIREWSPHECVSSICGLRCNMHLLELAEEVKAGVQVSDG